MVENNAVVQVKQFLVVINLWLSKQAKMGEINVIVKVKQLIFDYQNWQKWKKLTQWLK